VGTLGDFGCFSFQAVKNLAMGDGGALVAADPAVPARARRLRWMGIDGNTRHRTGAHHSYWWQYNVDEIGYRYSTNDILAAIGLVQLGKLEAANARRREIAEMYTVGLRGLNWLQTPPGDTEASKSAWHIYCIQAEGRDALGAHLLKRGIETGVHYKPIHRQACYGEQPALPAAEKAAERILSLPMHPGLTDEEIWSIIEAARGFAPPAKPQ
jgi:perosamine synthetase